MKVLVLLLSLSLISCSTISNMVSTLTGSKKEEPKSKKRQGSVANTYNRNQNFQSGILPQRQYGRMNQEKFEEEAKIEPSEGSLWVMEGQTSYLFSQNRNRLEGDVLNVEVEDQAKDQIDGKVSTISNLLKEREERRKLAALRSENPNAELPKKEEEKATPEEEAKIDISMIPSRITKSYPDGSYRIRGTKNITIRNKEFQVLVTGLVKGSDIANDKIATGKLLDAKYDVITDRSLR